MCVVCTILSKILSVVLVRVLLYVERKWNESADRSARINQPIRVPLSFIKQTRTKGTDLNSKSVDQSGFQTEIL